MQQLVMTRRHPALDKLKLRILHRLRLSLSEITKHRPQHTDISIHDRASAYYGCAAGAHIPMDEVGMLCAMMRME